MLYVTFRFTLSNSENNESSHQIKLGHSYASLHGKFQYTLPRYNELEQ